MALRPSWLIPRRIVFAVIVPVALVGVVTATILSRQLMPRTRTYLVERNHSDLVNATLFALETCEFGLENLLALRLASEPAMVETVRADTIDRVMDLQKRYSAVQLLIMRGDALVAASDDFSIAMIESALPLPIPAPEHPVRINSPEPAYIFWRYFPFYRWHIVGYLSDADGLGPLTQAQWVIGWSVVVLLSAFTLALVAVFFLLVARPLSRLTWAAESVTQGEYRTVPVERPDEIGQLAKSFNAMVDELRRRARESRELTARLQRGLREKEVLLQEVHHRVRNNLSVIVSLLSLRAMKMEQNEEVVQAFEESKERIRAMALVHSRLYESGDFSHIGTVDYIGTLANEISRSRDPQGRVGLEHDLQPIKVDLNRAIPLGLIVNEALTNAYNHAFDGVPNGKIRLTFRKDAENRCCLAIRDNGRGIDATGSPRHGLGMTLIEELTKQLGGELHIRSEHGLSVEVRFPCPPGQQE